MKETSGIWGILFMVAAGLALGLGNFIVMGLLCIAGAILFGAAVIAETIEKKK